MAHFFTPSNEQRVSHEVIPLAAGEVLELALWGYEETTNTPLDITMADTNTVCFAGLPRDWGNVRTFSVLARSLGVAKIEAKSSNGAVWDWVCIGVVKAKETPTKVLGGSVGLKRAVEAGKLRFLYPQAQNVFQLINDGNFKFEGHNVRFSEGLVHLLLKLVDTGGCQIMRSFAGRDTKTGKLQGAHTGDLVGGSYVCGAVDITSYSGGNFNFLQPKDSLIEAVLRLLRNLPPGAKYDLGFPRPVGGPPGLTADGKPIGFDPAQDVFYPIKTLEQAWAGYNGNQRPLSEIYDPPRAQVMAALAGKQIGYTYADAADHFHIKAYS